jgi:hypothetical protein
VQTPSALDEAIEGLYSAFAIYPLPRNTDHCTHCHTEADEARLRSKPLRKLGLEELRDYACDALWVWGDNKVFRHFLPRIYELYVNTPNAPRVFDDPEIIFSKFRYGAWRTWPPNEQTAVERFLHSFWDEILTLAPGPAPESTDIESWLCSISRAEDDLESYLGQWLDTASLSSCLALSSFILTSAITRSETTGRNAFWEDCKEQYLQLRKWVYTPEVLDRLENAANREDWKEHRAEFEAAASMLRMPE